MTTRTSDAYEDVPWDKSTFHLPRKPPRGDELPGSEKNRYYQETVTSLDAASAPSLTKFNVFLSRFDHDNLATEINGSFRPLYNATEGFGGPIRMTNPAVYAFTGTCSSPVTIQVSDALSVDNHPVSLVRPTLPLHAAVIIAMLRVTDHGQPEERARKKYYELRLKLNK